MHRLALIAAVLLSSAGCRYVTVNDVTSGESEAYPDLISPKFKGQPSVIFKRAAEVARATEGWTECRVVDKLTLHCECETETLGLIDDVWIWTEAAGDGATVVKMRSASRRGFGDLGENARRIEAYFDALVPKPLYPVKKPGE